jgi:hypothetical protein
MRIFNRIVVVLLLAGLVALGISAFVYALNLGGHQLSNLPNTLGLSGLHQGLENFIGNSESGSLNALDITVLVVIALFGLILLLFELFKRPAPRKVLMQKGTYVRRSAVENEASGAAEQSPEVLQSDVDVNAQRKPGARVNVTASVRRGEDTGRLQSDVQERVRQRLAKVGVPVGNLKVRVVESDPRETKTRVN